MDALAFGKREFSLSVSRLIKSKLALIFSTLSSEEERTDSSMFPLVPLATLD